MEPREEENPYPMRINKYLAVHNYSTRRGGDELVQSGVVFINGKMAVLGDKVQEGDKVEVRLKGKPKAYRYVAYNKPRGTVTHSAQEGEEDIEDALSDIEELQGLFPVGRLDKDSYGLIILTDDGRVTDRLLNPKFEHEKEYEVTTVEKLRSSFQKNMEMGVDIEGYRTRGCKVTVTGDYSFRVILSEGKRHQIRRMVMALHNTVEELKRVRVLNIKLGRLPQGDFRYIEGAELQTFLKELGLL